MIGRLGVIKVEQNAEAPIMYIRVRIGTMPLWTNSSSECEVSFNTSMQYACIAKHCNIGACSWDSPMRHLESMLNDSSDSILNYKESISNVEVSSDFVPSPALLSLVALQKPSLLYPNQQPCSQIQLKNFFLPQYSPGPISCGLIPSCWGISGPLSSHLLAITPFPPFSYLCEFICLLFKVISFSQDLLRLFC